MKYHVYGTMRFNVRMTIEANSEAAAKQQAMDRMDEGSLDGFDLGESVNDNEICEIDLAD